ncbi:hypothetical protein BV375_20535 [Nostoc sp. 106C]|nr:hypothetical protein BV375_20535 [Nostoc sp. 106C]
MLATNLLRSISPLTRKSHLFRPVYTSLFMLVLLIFGQHGLNLWLVYLNHKACQRVTHTLVVEREGQHLLNAVIDKERSTLEGYQQEQFVFNDSLNSLYKLLKDNPSQLKQLDRIKYLYKQWQSEFSQEKVANSPRSHSGEEIVLFDALRTQIDNLIVYEEKLLSDRKNFLFNLYQINIFINFFSSVAILLLASFNIQVLHRRAKVPLHKLAEVSKLWRKGEMEVQIGYSSPDEVGELAEVLDAMTNEIHQRQTSIKERNQHLEDLICALSHDLRSPLLATRNTLDAMLREAFGPVNDTWREVFEDYHQANTDLLKLVEALVDVSRYEAGCGIQLNYEPLNWEEIFVKVITQIKATLKSELALIYRISQSLPTIYGDELEIRRVLQNLLENAVRVSEANKEIVLEVATLGESQVQVCVRDRGLGIAPEEKERLFHRFIQGRTRRGKSGLGLYLCRQIVEAHGGSIGVESSLGEGSTFWFTLPVHTDEARFQDESKLRRSTDVRECRTEYCEDFAGR